MYIDVGRNYCSDFSYINNLYYAFRSLNLLLYTRDNVNKNENTSNNNTHTHSNIQRVTIH